MFTKLLKNEWRATRGLLGLLCLVSLSGALVGGVTMRYLTRADEDETLMVVLCVLAMMAAIFCIVGSAVAALILLVGRFYKSRFTDEGYLTFTLPVTTHEILLSSLTSSALGMIAIGLVTAASLLVMFTLGFSGVPEFWKNLFENVPYVLRRVLAQLGAEEWRLIGMLLLNLVLSFGCELVVLMLSVTVGSLIAQKHKILAAVGVYYGVHMVLSIASSVLMVTRVSAAVNGSMSDMGFFGATAVQSLLVALGGYLLMYFLVEKKLNLN